MKVFALIAGILFLMLGIAGLVPSLAVGGMLFDVLPVNTMYSVVYAVAGAAAILIGIARRRDLVPPAPRGPDLRHWV